MTAISLKIERHASKTLRRLIIALHGLAVLAALSNTLPLLVKIVILSFIILSVWREWSLKNQHPPAIALLYSGGLGWQELQHGIATSIKILPTSLITPFLIIVYYKKLTEHAATASFICFSDAVSASTFRQFLVRLKLTSDFSQGPKI